jgi:enoyl-CoA hydratase
VPYETLTLVVADRIATITVNRPEKLNALNDATMGELGAAAQEVRTRADVAGVILTGAGRSFVAGADISELAGQRPLDARRRALRGQGVFELFESCPKPVVAAVNGFALGGGCELAMACHIRIASETAKFGQPEVKLGITPGYGGTQRLPRLVGRGRAMQLLLTGETIDAAEAWRIGLVNKSVPAGQELRAARDLAHTIAQKAPKAVQAAKKAINEGISKPLGEGIDLETRLFTSDVLRSSDLGEGLLAFVERRPPKFQGA